jgi:hypothetical protein
MKISGGTSTGTHFLQDDPAQKHSYRRQLKNSQVIRGGDKH